MDTRLKRSVLKGVLASLGFVGAIAFAATFNLFQPATGILVGNSSTYITSAAAWSNIQSLLSGTCNSTVFVRGDGACTAVPAGVVPGGANTNVQYNSSGAFAGNSGFTYDGSGNISLTGRVSATGLNNQFGTTATGSFGAVLNLSSDTSHYSLHEATDGNGNQIALGTNNSGSTQAGLPTGTVGIGTTSVLPLHIATAGHGIFLDDNTTFSSGVVVGAPTGGNKGVGTLNAVGLYVGGVAVGTGGGSPGGSSGQIQFNSGGTFGGDVGMTWDNTNKWEVLTNPTAGVTNLFECNSSNSANLRCFSQRIGSGANGAYTLQPALDNFTLGNASLTVTRDTSANNTGIFLSNTTDNAPVTIQGTGGLQTAFLGIGRAPSSGVTKIVADNGGSGDTEIVAQTTTAGNSQFRAVNLGGGNWSWGNLRSSGDFVICPNSTLTGCTFDMNASGGGVTFASASAITLKSKTSTAAQDAQIEIQGAATALGGLCTSDTAAVCGTGQAANDVDFFLTGILHIGPTTGAAASDYITAGASGVSTGAATLQGAGTFNAASQIYQAGNPIYREVSWAGTCTSGGCITGISKGTGSVTRNSAGNYTVPFSAGTTSGNAGCTASTWSTLNNGALSTNIASANTTSVTVVVLNSSGTGVDSGFTVVCIG